MNETEKDRLLRLYKLLWEQIKDKDTFCLCGTLGGILSKRLITGPEYRLIGKHLYKNKPIKHNRIYWWGLTTYGMNKRKAFVQRMIKELENDK